MKIFSLSQKNEKNMKNVKRFSGRFVITSLVCIGITGSSCTNEKGASSKRAPKLAPYQSHKQLNKNKGMPYKAYKEEQDIFQCEGCGKFYGTQNNDPNRFCCAACQTLAFQGEQKDFSDVDKLLYRM